MASLTTRMRRARAAYLRRRSNERLRTYLTLKGKLGRFDDRMCSYYGVPIPRNRHVRAFVARAYGGGLVPTATSNGQHSALSYHKLGRAADVGVRVPEVGTEKGRRKLEVFQRKELWRAEHGRTHPVELLGPSNFRCILKGRRVTLAEGAALENQHDNHVHGAF